MRRRLVGVRGRAQGRAYVSRHVNHAEASSLLTDGSTRRALDVRGFGSSRPRCCTQRAWRGSRLSGEPTARPNRRVVRRHVSAEPELSSGAARFARLVVLAGRHASSRLVVLPDRHVRRRCDLSVLPRVEGHALLGGRLIPRHMRRIGGSVGRYRFEACCPDSRRPVTSDGVEKVPTRRRADSL